MFSWKYFLYRKSYYVSTFLTGLSFIFRTIQSKLKKKTDGKNFFAQPYARQLLKPNTHKFKGLVGTEGDSL